MTKRMWILLGALGVLLAGCSSPGRQQQAQPSGLARTEDIGRAAVQAARCMRDHGYAVPDPTFNDQGLPEYGDLRGVVPNKTAEFDQIRASCFQPLADALQAAGVPNAKEVKPEELLGFARCMREHGIDIPDPTPEDLLSIPKNAYYSPAWGPAKQACESLLPESWRGFLEPPSGPDVKQGGGK